MKHTRHWALSHIWALNSLQIEQLDKYYLLHWEPEHFLKQITYDDLGRGVIVREDIEYVLRLNGFNLPDCVFDKTVRLSFRKHKDEDIGIVMVKRNLLNESTT